MDEISSRDKQQLDRYVTSYNERELIQPPEGAGADPQLATIILKLAEIISGYDEGVIVDLGCGHGTLLKRIAELPSFKDRVGWIYVAVDEVEKLDELSRVSRELGLSRRVEPISLFDFYAEWPNIGSPQVLFCRNVLHELTMSQTSELLSHVARNLGVNDHLIIQDLMRFPESERHHVCWLPEKLSKCVADHCFDAVTVVPQGSQSGNAWFNLTAKGGSNFNLSETTSRSLVIQARQEQWKLWSDLDTEAERNLPNRSELIQALDLDLQLTSLTRALHGAGVLNVALDDAVARRMQHREFALRIDQFVKEDVLEKQSPPEQRHFRERGQQQDEMESFLRSPGRLALVHGGGGTGKTSFVNHVINGRIYEKSFVRIDGKNTRTFWPVVEQLFAQVGLHLASDLLNAAEGLDYDRVQPAISQFLNKFANQLVIVVEDFDRSIDSNGYFIDLNVGKLLELIISKPSIKLLITSNNDFLPPALKAANSPELPTIVHMGRFGSDQPVINVLDDHFDRAVSGVGDYPTQLIEAIDRHPLIATLAGQILGQQGRAILLDEEFISEVRRKLRSELTGRLVNDQSRDAIEVSSKLRVPVPAFMLEQLTTKDSIYQAQASEVLYAVPDRVWSELITSLGLFRLQTVVDLTPTTLKQENKIDNAFHDTVSEVYLRIYGKDDDPKWIRESHFHKMLSGNMPAKELPGFAGKFYVPELVASAYYSFRTQKNYKVALELYDAASTLSDLDEQALMWRASCLIRTGDWLRGSEEYKTLTAKYPKNNGIKTSHVDALLHTGDWQGAKTTLEQYGLKPEFSNWVATQWGRVYLGLHRYDLCIPIFETTIAGGAADPHIYVYAARAHQQFGDLETAIEILSKGAAAYPNNNVIQTSLGSDLERAKRDDEAMEILSPIFDRHPSNSRAALGIIRVMLREGNVYTARKTLKRAKKFAISSMEWVVSTAEAEITIADGDPKTAAHFLRDRVSKDESLVGIMIDAYTSLILSSNDRARRNAIFEEVNTITLPQNLNRNVPVLVTRANLAIAANSESMFEEVINDLASTKIKLLEIEQLKHRWSENLQRFNGD